MFRIAFNTKYDFFWAKWTMGLLAINIDIVFINIITLDTSIAVVVLSEGTAAITGKGGF